VVVEQPAVAAQALQDHPQHRVGHRGELGQRLVAVEALLEVHLRHGLEAHDVARVQQHRGLDRVAGGEREPLEQRPAGAHLPRERLGEGCQFGIEGR
jgi:hypothetical protein